MSVCKSCWKEVPAGKGDGVSIDSITIDVCMPCWMEMRPFERVLLVKLFTIDEDGTFASVLLALSDMLEDKKETK